MGAIVAALLFGCESSTEIEGEDGSSDEGVYTTLDELEDKRLGVTTGSIQADQVEERFPNAEIYYYSASTDLVNALEANKIDAFGQADILIRYMMGENDRLTYIDELLADGMNCSGIFPKTDEGQRLCDEYDEFIEEVKASGEYDEILEIWTGGDKEKQVAPDLEGLEDINGTLNMAVDLTMTPFAYMQDNQPVGVDIEMAYRFAKSRGYALKLDNMDFGAIIPAITSGKNDFDPGGVVYTEERAKSVLFSKPTYEGGSAMAVLKKGASAKGSFWESIAESFEKTFIREDRWQLFLVGIGNTLFITVAAIVIGTILGFLAFLLCRRGGAISNKVAGAAIWLINGIPVVVLLMVLYYVVFGNTDLSGLVVSVIAFSLIFGAAMFGMLRSGTAAVDSGQTEAAYALGYTDRQAFFRMILPQAAFHFMPTYRAQVVSLLKATSVVGYIAVQDLTKMGDIVRSRTYEAFFPLIAVTVIYFILAAILIWAIAALTRHIDPKTRSAEKILKGVKTHD